MERELIEGESDDPPLNHVGALAEIRARAHSQRSRSHRVVAALTAQLGTPTTIVVLLAIVVLWSSWNGLEFVRYGTAWDPPPFFWLQGGAGVFAALTATIILTAQNREKVHDEKRLALELHVNLAAEQKIAKVIKLLEELRRDLPMVENRVDSQAETLQNPVNAIAVVASLEALAKETDDAP